VLQSNGHGVSHAASLTKYKALAANLALFTTSSSCNFASNSDSKLCEMAQRSEVTQIKFHVHFPNSFH
jgi:hypothetical protein